MIAFKQLLNFIGCGIKYIVYFIEAKMVVVYQFLSHILGKTVF